MRLISVLCCVLSIASFSVRAQADTGCSEALVKATYSRITSDYYAWSLATQLTEKQWDEIKHDASAGATIYGIPMSASYADYHKSASEKTSSYASSLTTQQATNVQWTGLDPGASNAYSDCLKALYAQGGLHLGVKSATKKQVSVEISWSPIGNAPRVAMPQWVWGGADRSNLPRTIPAGVKVIVLKRPADQQILAVNLDGRADSLTIEPYPAVPAIAVDNPPSHLVVPLDGHNLKSVAYWSERHASQEFSCIEATPAHFTRVDVQVDRLERGRRRTCAVPPPYCDSVGETCDEYILSRGCFVSTDWLAWYKRKIERSGIPYSNEAACQADLALQ